MSGGMIQRPPSGPSSRAKRTAVNALGALVVGLGARLALRSYLDTHRLIGVVFVAQQIWVSVAFLARRPPLVVSRRPLDWLAAYGGSFGGFLLRPTGYHPAWGVHVGLGLQVLGLACWAWAFFALARSFGLVPADRGLVTRGPYRMLRHPLYGSYMIAQLGYLLQSVSWWNLTVLAATWGCQVGRALAEEHLLILAEPRAYAGYRARVRWRLIPGIW